MAVANNESVPFYQSINATKRFRLLTRKKGVKGNEYIYLCGVASCAVGSVVTFDETGTPTLSVTGASGPVAISMSANTSSSTYSWFQVFGKGSALYNGSAVAGKPVYSASTGKCDDAVVSGDQIDGAFVGATVSGAGLGDILLNYPSMNHQG